MEMDELMDGALMLKNRLISSVHLNLCMHKLTFSFKNKKKERRKKRKKEKSSVAR